MFEKKENDEACSIYYNIVRFDDLLWLADHVLYTSFVTQDKEGCKFFHLNNNQKDHKEYLRVVKLPSPSFGQLYKIYGEVIKRDIPDLKDLASYLFDEDPFVYPKEGVLATNINKVYEYLTFMVELKNITFRMLSNHFIDYGGEMDPSYRESMERAMKANETYVRVGLMLDIMYYIFDDPTNSEKYYTLFKEVNKFVLVEESPKYRELYEAIDKLAVNYIESGEVDRLAITHIYDELLVYRRNSYATYSKYNFYFAMEFLE